MIIIYDAGFGSYGTIFWPEITTIKIQIPFEFISFYFPLRSFSVRGRKQWEPAPLVLHHLTVSLQPEEFSHWHLWPDSKFLYCSKTAKWQGQGAETLSEFILLKLEVWSCLTNKISLHHSPCSSALQSLPWTRQWKAIKKMMNTEVAQASSNEAFCTQPPSLHPKLIRE